MDIDYKPFFKRYEKIREQADTAFKSIGGAHPSLVKCKEGCSDCCYALFDLTLTEAIYINHHFNKKVRGKEKVRLIEEANKADRAVYRIKRKAFKDVQDGKNEVEVLMRLAGERIRCPLLNSDNLCTLYDKRPITCRLYGIPTAIAGMGHTCGMSGFVEGDKYPTVNLDIIQQELFRISADLIKEIQSRNVKMSDMLIPLSMAIITEFDETYLGIDEIQPGKPIEQARKKS